MSANAERFGRIVKERRLELDLNQLEVGDMGGPSNSKLTDIENGRLVELTRITARRLDRGLRWEPGSARDVWAGGDPRPLGPSRAQIKGAEAVLELRQAVLDAHGIDDSTRERLLEILDDKSA